MQEKKMEKLEVKHLSKAFDKLQVLHDVSFTVHTGEFLSVLGSSGCGKTSLLRILIGLESPECGTILKDGKNITALAPEKRNMGFVFQNYALFENMSALKNVEYALRKSSATKGLYTKGNANRKAKEMLDLVGLSDHQDKKPCELSGGQQQRVAIARTLALNPDVILLDEPMSALDVDTRLTLRSELKDLQRKFGTTMIYITHDQEEAFSLSDRIMVMKEGCIHQIDTPDHIIDHPADEFVVNFVINNINIKIDSLVRFARHKTEGMRL
ncbi:MAG: ABC transporter ATP-binding protein [Oscillospiraceae bacterium]|nr:ABC transporter ATP-binding protein [Oscillospiraceae bacterium]